MIASVTSIQQERGERERESKRILRNGMMLD